MALPELQQALSIIDRATALLLIVPQKPSLDAFASMVGLYVALLECHKGEVNAVCTSHVPRQLQFLAGSSQVTTEPHLRPEVVLDVAGANEHTGIRTQKLNGGLRLHISLPPEAHVSKDNVEVHVRTLPYDAVITLGTSDLEDLGKLFTTQADFFYSTPVINIDHRANNEYFGTVNVVDITASSIAEVTHELISQLPNVTLAGSIATSLYAGIVAATDSFQKPSTTPRAFELAADLLNKKADKETVIQYLVKTKPIHLLKLSGRTYARLRHDEHGKLYWSILRTADFVESGASGQDITDVMRELTNNISGYNAVFLLYEGENRHYTVYLLLGKGLIKRRQEIQKQLRAQRENGALTLRFSAESLEEAEQQTLEHIRQIVPRSY